MCNRIVWDMNYALAWSGYGFTLSKLENKNGDKDVRTLLLTSVMLLSGCVSEQALNWSATGGSRADATVELGYQYNPTVTKPVLQQSQADTMAAKRCEAWGYADAEPFGIARNQCQQTGLGIYNGACIDMWVTLQYQCLGRGDK